MRGGVRPLPAGSKPRPLSHRPARPAAGAPESDRRVDGSVSEIAPGSRLQEPGGDEYKAASLLARHRAWSLEPGAWSLEPEERSDDMRRILVTGACGYIAAQLLPAFRGRYEL